MRLTPAKFDYKSGLHRFARSSPQPFLSRNKKYFAFVLLVCITLFIIFQSVFSIKSVYSLPSNLFLSENDLKAINIKNITYEVKASQEDENNKITFKLFNLFPIKTINASIEEKRNAYLGGYPVGLSVKANGVIVVKKAQIETYAGTVYPETGVEEGDLIIQINDKKVLYVSDIINEIDNFNKDGKVIEIKVLRNGEEKKVFSYPVIENLTGYYKLGLAVKDTQEGVGTMSYVKSDGRFGSLGHAIGSSSSVMPCYSGAVYKCKLLGYTKGLRGDPGELKGAFYDIENPIGEINSSNNFGVFGNLKYISNKKTYEIGSRFQVKMGKAKICTTINDKPEFFDIEIIKSSSQSFPCEKGMIIRVTDKNLLSQTGGILQGMSGSPIIQNNKIIGVVTHVLISDPTKGYAVFLDWMFDN